MERLFDAIPDVLKGLAADRGTSDALVFAAWKQCAGKLITERTEPVEYFESRLVVAVADASWRAHLEDLSPQMIARMNATVGQGSVKFIEFRVDASVFREGKNSSVEKSEPPLAELSSRLTDAANAISDQRLRNSFLAAAAAYLAKK